MSLENKITDLTQAIHTLTITLENHMAAMSDIPVAVSEPEFVKETIEIEPGNTVIDVVHSVPDVSLEGCFIVGPEEAPVRSADEVRELAKTIIKTGLLTRSEVKAMISELGASEINKLSEEGLSSLYAQLEGHKE
jgi:hypothetical protein